jgi:hypothetical protein
LKNLLTAFVGLVKIIAALGMCLLLFGVVIICLSIVLAKPGTHVSGVMEAVTGLLLILSSFVGMGLAKLLGYQDEGTERKKDDPASGDSD